MVYSTCSISPEENECQVYWALQTFTCLNLAEQVSLMSHVNNVCTIDLFLGLSPWLPWSTWLWTNSSPMQHGTAIWSTSIFQRAWLASAERALGRKRTRNRKSSAGHSLLFYC